MTNPPTESVISPAVTLARAAFVLALLFMLSAVLTLVPFAWLHKDQPLIAGVCAAVLISAGFAVRATWRMPQQQLVLVMQKVQRWLEPRRTGLALMLGLLEINLLGYTTYFGLPIDFLLVLMFISIATAEVWLVLWLIHQRAVLRQINRFAGLWLSAGLTFFCLIGAVALLELNQPLIEAVNTRTEAQNSPTWIFNDSDDAVLTRPDAMRSTAIRYWQDYNALAEQWRPYVYWQHSPVANDAAQIHVDAEGIRQTVNVAADMVNSTAAPQVFIFGGSAVWGTGVRDAHTLPSELATLSKQMGKPLRIVNFAEIGYVNGQELILFQMQLLRGNVPDLAIFYDGFNDIYSAYQTASAGLPQNELNRVKDFQIGRALSHGTVLERGLAPYRPVLPLNSALISSPGQRAEDIAARYLQQLRLIRAIADAYHVRVLFIWQPSLYGKQTLNAFEQSAYQAMLLLHPGFGELVRAVNYQIAIQRPDDLLILTDVFDHDPHSVFFDEVHITEFGNRSVAQRLLPDILARLSEYSVSSPVH